MEDKKEFKKVLDDETLNKVNGGTLYWAHYLCSHCGARATRYFQPEEGYPIFSKCDTCGENMVREQYGTFM